MDDDKLTAQFSSGQLVIGICVSLFVLLAAFLLGVLVGKYDSSLRNPEGAPTQGVQTGSAAAPPSDAGGRQTTPRRPEPVTLPPVEAPEVDTSQGRVSELPPLPANASETPASEPAPPAIETAPPPPPPLVAQAPIEPPPALPQAPAVVVPPAETAAPVPEAVPAPELTSPPPPPVLEPSTPEEPEDLIEPVAPQGFGIQVISLSGPDRAAKAVEVQRKLQASGYQSIVSQYDGGKKYAVMAVGFADKAAAAAASQELKKIKEFKDCFIKKLS